MASQNDIVWLSLHAGELTRQQLDALDLSMLRSFEPHGMGYSVEMFKVGDCETAAKVVPEGSGFVEALERSAAAFYGAECPYSGEGGCRGGGG